MPEVKKVSRKHTTTNIAQKVLVRVDSILNTHTTDDTWQAFPMLDAFMYVYRMEYY